MAKSDKKVVEEKKIIPREVFKTAILSNAVSIVMIHNHPSGDVTPSKKDKEITLRIKESGTIYGNHLVHQKIRLGKKKILLMGIFLK